VGKQQHGRTKGPAVMKQQSAKEEGVETWRGGAHISHGVGDGNMARVTGVELELQWRGDGVCLYLSVVMMQYRHE
jgi:hypothetical protein